MRDVTEKTMRGVVRAVSGIRLTMVGLAEWQIADAIAESLAREGLTFEREVVLGRGARIDFVVAAPGDAPPVGIEVKKGRPSATALARQVARYAATGRLGGVVVVSERLGGLPEAVDGIPVTGVALHGQYGISL